MSGAQVFLETAKMLGAVPAPVVTKGGPNYPHFDDTQNFRFYCQRTLGDKGKAVAATLKQKCEASLSDLKRLFGGNPAKLPFKVYVADITGAMHKGCANIEIYVGVIEASQGRPVPPISHAHSLLLAAEVAEVLAANIAPHWRCDYNNGEALSRVLATDLYQNDELIEFVTASDWLFKKSPEGSRPDWVNRTENDDTNKFSVGCSVLFLNWLHDELKCGWKQIISVGAHTLAETYEKLELGDRNEAWGRFIAEMNARFPPSKPFQLHTDNPFRKPPAIG